MLMKSWTIFEIDIEITFETEKKDWYVEIDR